MKRRPNPRDGGAAVPRELYGYLLVAGNAYLEAVALDGRCASSTR